MRETSSPRLPTTYLHIGAMKTGTTYLQALMFANKAELSSAGLLVPGVASYEQALAARDILEMRGGNAQLRARTQGAWDKITSEMLRHQDKTAVISMEFFGFSNPERAARVVHALSGAELHVVITVRDAAKTIPAQWQTHCRNGGTVSWPAFARQVRRTPLVAKGGRSPKGARVFSRSQGVPRMLQVWGGLIPKERLHVVVVPANRDEPELLWRRFAAVVGVDPGICTVPVVPRNSSLGYASADLIRRVNLHLGKPVTAECSAQLRQLALILATRSAHEDPVSMDPKTRQFSRRWNRHTRRAVQAMGVDVVGDLSELPGRPPAMGLPAASRIEEPDVEDVVAAAQYAVKGLMQLLDSATQMPVPLEHPGPRYDGSGDITSAVAEVASMVTMLHDTSMHDTSMHNTPVAEDEAVEPRGASR